jgi:FAD/FMN-containing dehydrogenase
MNKTDLDLLEAFVDKYGIDEVISGLSFVCSAKSEHIATAWQDTKLAKSWMLYSAKLDRINDKV